MEIKARKEVEKGAKTDLFKLMEEHGRDRLTSGIWERALKHGDDLATTDRPGREGAGRRDRLGGQPARPRGGDHRRRARGALRREVRRPDRDPRCTRTSSRPDRPPHMHVATLGDFGGAIGAALLGRISLVDSRGDKRFSGPIPGRGSAWPQARLPAALAPSIPRGSFSRPSPKTTIPWTDSRRRGRRCPAPRTGGGRPSTGARQSRRGSARRSR